MRNPMRLSSNDATALHVNTNTLNVQVAEVCAIGSLAFLPLHHNAGEAAVVTRQSNSRIAGGHDPPRGGLALN